MTLFYFSVTFDELKYLNQPNLEMRQEQLNVMLNLTTTTTFSQELLLILLNSNWS